MPVVLFSIDGTDNTSGAFQKATSGLSGLDNAYTRASGSSAAYDRAQAAVASSASRVTSAQLQVEAATLRQAQALQQATTAADRYGSVIASVATAGGDAASSQLRLSTAFDASSAAQTRAQTAALRTAESLNKLALAQDTATRNEEKLRAAMNTPIKDPAASSGGGSGGGGGYSYAKSMIGYIGAYAAYSAVSGSLGRDATYSRLLGSTAAMTGLSPAAAAQLGSLTTAQSASGTLPYDRSTLLQGDYSLASLGIGKGNASTISGVEGIIAKGSAASGAADTSIIGDTLTTLLAAFGLNTSSVVANTQKLSDQLTVGIKLGKVDAPGFATAAGGPVANMAKTLGVSTSDVISAIAAESVGGIATGELGNDTYALLRGSARPTKTQQREAAALGIQYDSSFWGTNGIAGGSNIIESAMQRQGITGAMQAPVLGALLGKQDAANAFMALQSGNIQGIAPQVAGSAGATNSAYLTSQSYAGAKLQDASVKLSTAFDNLTTQALPALTAAASLAAEAMANLPGVNSWLDNLARAVDLPGKGAALDKLPGGSNALLALANFTPAGPLFDALKGASMVMASHPNVSGGGTAPVSGGTGGAASSTIGQTYAIAGTYSASWYQSMGINPNAPGNRIGLKPGTALAGVSTAVPDLSAAGRSYDHSYTASSYTGPLGTNSAAYLASASGASAAKKGTRSDSSADRAFTSPELVDSSAAIAAAALAKTDALNRTMKDLQNTISIQQLGGNAGGQATAQAALLAFETKNAKALKLDPSDLALLAAQNAASMMAMNPTVNTHPFFQKQQGLSSFDAGSGSTLVRAGGVDPATQEIRRLQAELAAANGEIVSLLTTIARNSGIRSGSSAGNPNHGGMR